MATLPAIVDMAALPATPTADKAALHSTRLHMQQCRYGDIDSDMVSCTYTANKAAFAALGYNAAALH